MLQFNLRLQSFRWCDAPFKPLALSFSIQLNAELKISINQHFEFVFCFFVFFRSAMKLLRNQTYLPITLTIFLLHTLLSMSLSNLNHRIGSFFTLVVFNILLSFIASHISLSWTVTRFSLLILLMIASRYLLFSVCLCLTLRWNVFDAETGA